MEQERVPKLVTVTVVERPARKLLLLRSKKAICFETFCEEMGCGWLELLNSIPEKFDTSALITLPPSLVTEGTSNIAGAVEVPADYAKEVPSGYELIDLPPCSMMYFQGVPFERQEDYPEAIGTVYSAADRYTPEAYGYRYDYDIAPQFNFGAEAETGAKMALPVVKAERE